MSYVFLTWNIIELNSPYDYFETYIFIIKEEIHIIWILECEINPNSYKMFGLAI